MMHPGPHHDKSEGSGLLLFAIGGRRIAARTDDIAEVAVWGAEISLPSRTPYVHSLVRQGNEIVAAYDLAGHMQVKPIGEPPLCLIAKHQRGALALCIDAALPVVRTMDPLQMHRQQGNGDIAGTCQLGDEVIPIYSLATLGSHNGAETDMSARP